MNVWETRLWTVVHAAVVSAVKMVGFWQLLSLCHEHSEGSHSPNVGHEHSDGSKLWMRRVDTTYLFAGLTQALLHTLCLDLSGHNWANLTCKKLR